MGTDVATFAKQLREDGVEAGKKEAEQIRDEARIEAGKIIEEAKLAAEKFRQDAESALVREKARFEAEIQLVARDLMLELKRQVETVAAALLKERTAAALDGEEFIREAVMTVLKHQEPGGEWELAVGHPLSKSLAELSAGGLFGNDATIVRLTDGFEKAGFELRGADGSAVIEVSDESTAEAFRKLMSPELKKILDGAAARKSET